MNVEAVSSRHESAWDSRADLMRALAAESRNALARIELAASEIARFAPMPSLASRLDAIHSAVSEIDGLLGRMDGVTRSRSGDDLRSCPVGPVVARVMGRVAPVLRARGLVLERAPGLEGGAELAVSMPEALFESVVLGLLGALASLSDAPVRIETSIEGDETEVAIVGRLVDETRQVAFRVREETLQLELGVELGEWGGRLVVDRAGRRLEARLPRAGVDAAVGVGGMNGR